MERSLGPVAETQNITTYCMSPLSEMDHYDIVPLVCKEAFAFYSDAEAIKDFRGSPWFSNLDNIQMVYSNVSNISSDEARLLSTLCILVIAIELLLQ